MQESRQFMKLPKVAQFALTTYLRDTNKSKLFTFIQKNVDSQGTVKSKSVRLSMFRGLLRKYGRMDNADMKAIESTTEQKQAYFESNKTSFDKQKESTVTVSIFDELLNLNPLMYLLITSGLRVSELLTNPYKIVDGDFEITLNKKKESSYHKIRLLIPTAKWISLFQKVRKNNEDKEPKLMLSVINNLNQRLKGIIPKEFYKKSTHIARAIYIRLVKLTMEPDMTIPQLIMKYLNHDKPASSVHYQHVLLDSKLTVDIVKRLLIEAFNSFI